MRRDILTMTYLSLFLFVELEGFFSAMTAQQNGLFGQMINRGSLYEGLW